MNQNKKDSFMMIVFFTLIGLAIRLLPALSMQAPMNDGGLFHVMIYDLQRNGFILPEYTSYNLANIPFAYPPLGFYVTALISTTTSISVLDLLRILPPALSVLSIPAVYLLAIRLTKSEITSVLAAGIFSFIPLAFEWQVMGGGITRSFGQLFAILTWISLFDFYQSSVIKNVWKVILFGALVVLSHPEAALQTVIGAGLLWIFVSSRVEKLGWSLLCGLGITILTAPWWAVIFGRFGPDPFLSVFEAGRQNTIPFLLRILLLFKLDFADEPSVTLASVLGFLGLFIAFARRQYIVPVWMLAALIIDWRSGARFATIPLAILGGLVIEQAVIPIIGNTEKKNHKSEIERGLLGTTTMKFFTGFLFIILALGAWATINTIVQRKSLRADHVPAMEWLAVNTSSDSRIIVVSQNQPLLDPLTEWMPVFSKRHVMNSLFGIEWKDGDSFEARINAYNDLQSCAQKTLSCIENWEIANGRFDYLVLQKTPLANETLLPMQVYLNQSTQFIPVFDNDEVTIYESTPEN